MSKIDKAWTAAEADESSVVLLVRHISAPERLRWTAAKVKNRRRRVGFGATPEAALEAVK
jgi:hypothetical protein